MKKKIALSEGNKYELFSYDNLKNRIGQKVCHKVFHDDVPFNVEVDFEQSNQNVRVTVLVSTGKVFETEQGYCFEKTPDNKIVTV